MATKKKTALKRGTQKSAVRKPAAKKTIAKRVAAKSKRPATKKTAATNGTMAQIQELLDREAIRNLPVLYCHCVWKNDIPGMVDLFTEDGAISMADDPSVMAAKGRENLLKMYQQALGALTPRPFIHNHVVELQGPDRATGTCYVEIRANRKGKSWIGAGYYDDEYAKVGGKWKFRSRLVHMYYMVPLSEGWAEQAAGIEPGEALRGLAANPE